MKNSPKQALLRQIPSVNDLLLHNELQPVLKQFGREIVKYAIQTVVHDTRQTILKSEHPSVPGRVVEHILQRVKLIVDGSLKRVINATGIVLHTNLGRAPLGSVVLDEISKVLRGYCNLEFELETGGRGNRNSHLKEMLRFLTGAEDSLVVNNNAAALFLILSTFAKGKEVIVSRGELVEIGGSFRVPDILKESGCHMIEVGTTNRTRLSDYEHAITDDTAFILKIHKSNFEVRGFTEDVSIKELADLAHCNDLHLLYDQGSGLLKGDVHVNLTNEPNVASALQSGVDLVAFSGDKLLGGPQAGIIAGQKKLIKKLEKAQLFRALRVDKLTYAALNAVCKQYLGGELSHGLPHIYQMLQTSESDLKQRAGMLAGQISSPELKTRVVESWGQYGGGTLPDRKLPGFAVEIYAPENRDTSRSTFAERMYRYLLEASTPVASILREGKLLLDVLTIGDDELPLVVEAVNEAFQVETN